MTLVELLEKHEKNELFDDLKFIIKHGVSYGLCFQIGYMDGKGIPVNPVVRYASLGSPLTFNYIDSYLSSRKIKNIQAEIKNYIKTDKEGIKKELFCLGDDPDFALPLLEEFVNLNTKPEIISTLKESSNTVLITGIAYLFGYGFSKQA